MAQHTTVPSKSVSAQPPPREIAKGVFWLFACLEVELNGKLVHGHVSPYLIIGEEKTLMVDTGHPKDWDSVSERLDQALGSRALDFIFPTHSEMPHAGNLGRLAAKYPDAVICGDVRDYHLYYPEVVPQLLPQSPGDSIDLGGRSFTFLEGLMRDLPSTQWGFDSGSATLFVADAYGFTHEHEAGECALFAEELPELPTADQTVFINERALYWTRFVELAPTFARVEKMRREYGVRLVAPAHASVVSDPDRVVPAIEEVGYPKVG